MNMINRSVKRALEILQLLKDEEKPMNIAEICKAMNIPRSSVYDIVNTLYVEGFIETVSESTKSFKLGLRAFEIGAAYLSQIELAPTARPYLEKLMRRSEATAFLAIEHKGQLVYLDKVEAPTAVRTSAQLGSRNAMYCTGLGKAVMATYAEDRVKQIFKAETIKKHTERTITKYSQLKEELANTRKRGYATDDREANVEVFCVAAPIYDISNKAIAAISLAMLYSNLNADTIHRFADEVTSSALEISHKLGSLRNSLY
jgi:DNA-binding IclR family transcriptional regulator